MANVIRTVPSFEFRKGILPHGRKSSEKAVERRFPVDSDGGADRQRVKRRFLRANNSSRLVEVLEVIDLTLLLVHIDGFMRVMSSERR